MNILFLIIDMLRYDFVGYSGFRNLTSNLDQISKEGLIYKHAFSTGTSTPFSFPGILASVFSHQSRLPGVKGAPLTFAEYLKEKGYMTLGFNGGNAFISEAYGYGRGLDVLKETFTVQSRILLRKILMKWANERVIEILRKLRFTGKALLGIPSIYKAKDQIRDLLNHINPNKPFFAFIDFMEVHGPYWGLWKASLKERLLMVKLFLSRRYSTDRKWLEFNKYLYSKGLEIVDRSIGELLNLLDIKGILKNTIVVITSDHGEEFLEHGNYDHHPKPYDELIHVPLIVFIQGERFSQSEKETESEKLVSLIDLAPSISKYLFNEIPKEFMGKATIIGGESNREYIFSEGFRRVDSITHDPNKSGIHNWCIRTKEMKYMELDGKKYIFDLVNDPEEKKPTVVKDYSEIPSDIKELLADFKKEELKYKIRNKLKGG